LSHRGKVPFLQKHVRKEHPSKPLRNCPYPDQNVRNRQEQGGDYRKATKGGQTINTGRQKDDDTSLCGTPEETDDHQPGKEGRRKKDQHYMLIGKMAEGSERR